MSTITETYIICDGCGVQGNCDPIMNATRQRAVLAAKGWTHTSGEDLCKDCRPRRKDGQIWGTKLRIKSKTK